MIEIRRIYNRAIADELIVRKIQLPFDWTAEWDVEWAGHPNWYFLISKFSLPWLSRRCGGCSALRYFLVSFSRGGSRAVEAAGLSCRRSGERTPPYDELLLKPLFSFAGKGIQFQPDAGRVEADS